MLQITEHIGLKPITEVDATALFTLMNEVYTAAYKHFWKDQGNGYIQRQYGAENIVKELREEQTAYYFIVVNEEVVGNFRVLWNRELLGFPHKKSAKLHRLYLHPKSHGQGIGKTLMNWLENTAKERRYDLIWLDAMDAQPKAFQFYENLGYQYHSHCLLDFKELYDAFRKMSQLYKEL